jgi:hypothetical protein
LHILLSIVLIFVGIGLAYHFRAGLIKILLACIALAFLAALTFSLTAFHGVMIFSILSIVLGLIYLGVRIVNSAIRASSHDEEDYKKRRGAFIKFGFKWLLIYISFGFILEALLSLFIEKNEAFLVRLVYGSRVFLVILFILFLIKISKNRA